LACSCDLTVALVKTSRNPSQCRIDVRKDLARLTRPRDRTARERIARAKLWFGGKLLDFAEALPETKRGPIHHLQMISGRCRLALSCKHQIRRGSVLVSEGGQFLLSLDNRNETTSARRGRLLRRLAILSDLEKCSLVGLIRWR